mmetsp:Transcript_10138/g.31581  ORF Transcript_10138/g.31581 Transcript_10138/m.31581 type:complete len:299 (+) Transcript_10138:1342-2238(+)
MRLGFGFLGFEPGQVLRGCLGHAVFASDPCAQQEGAVASVADVQDARTHTPSVSVARPRSDAFRALRQRCRQLRRLCLVRLERLWEAWQGHPRRAQIGVEPGGGLQPIRWYVPLGRAAATEVHHRRDCKICAAQIPGNCGGASGGSRDRHHIRRLRPTARGLQVGGSRKQIRARCTRRQQPRRGDVAHGLDRRRAVPGRRGSGGEGLCRLRALAPRVLRRAVPPRVGRPHRRLLRGLRRHRLVGRAVASLGPALGRGEFSRRGTPEWPGPRRLRGRPARRGRRGRPARGRARGRGRGR